MNKVAKGMPCFHGGCSIDINSTCGNGTSPGTVKEVTAGLNTKFDLVC